MTPNNRLEGLQTLDVRISIPELNDVNSFWIRGYPTQRTFEELLQECVNYPDVRRSQKALEKVPASRHFWFGEQMLLREQPVSILAPKLAGNPEASLILRRDYYRIGPPQLVAGGKEYVWLDAERPVEELVALILSKEEQPCCFDLADTRKRRLLPDKTLASYELLPAWEDSQEAFPDRAVLRLQPRAAWLPLVLLIVAVILGVALGYFVLSAVLKLR